MRIEIISGSPRKNSATHRVALHLHEVLAIGGNDVGIIDVRDYDMAHLQSVITSVDAAPAKHKALAQRMFAADAFILLTPEYNGSYTPALKNLLDHFPKQSRKPFGIVTASPGAMGGMRAAMQLQQLIFALFGIGSPHMLITPFVDKKFDENGDLIDMGFQKSIDVFVQEFLWLAKNIVTEKVPA